MENNKKGVNKIVPFTIIEDQDEITNNENISDQCPKFKFSVLDDGTKDSYKLVNNDITKELKNRVYDILYKMKDKIVIDGGIDENKENKLIQHILKFLVNKNIKVDEEDLKAYVQKIIKDIIFENSEIREDLEKTKKIQQAYNQIKHENIENSMFTIKDPEFRFILDIDNIYDKKFEDIFDMEVDRKRNLMELLKYAIMNEENQIKVLSNTATNQINKRLEVLNNNIKKKNSNIRAMSLMLIVGISTFFVNYILGFVVVTFIILMFVYEYDERKKLLDEVKRANLELDRIRNGNSKTVKRLNIKTNNAKDGLLKNYGYYEMVEFYKNHSFDEITDEDLQKTVEMQFEKLAQLTEDKIREYEM